MKAQHGQKVLSRKTFLHQAPCTACAGWFRRRRTRTWEADLLTRHLLREAGDIRDPARSKEGRPAAPVEVRHGAVQFAIKVQLVRKKLLCKVILEGNLDHHLRAIAVLAEVNAPEAPRRIRRCPVYMQIPSGQHVHRAPSISGRPASHHLHRRTCHECRHVGWRPEPLPGEGRGRRSERVSVERRCSGNTGDSQESAGKEVIPGGRHGGSHRVWRRVATVGRFSLGGGLL
jgi:hypothetical protein